MLSRLAHTMCAFGLLANTAHAFISVRSSQDGAAVHWPQGSQLIYRANTTNRSGMSASDIFTIFTTSLNRWKQAALGGFDFVYYQGTDTSRYPNYLGSPQDNSIFFTSNSDQSTQLQCGVIALTQVWFDPGSGVASKADLRFNDTCYTFTNNPSDTRSQTRIYLGDVATHELGHSLGLDHSENLQSSMIYTAALEMNTPSCDDQAAMMTLYGGGNRSRVGILSGQVVSPSATAVFGAHVNVIELERGTVMASTITDKDGTFTVQGLEPGHYGVAVEPYYPGAATLGPYYSTINSNVCAGGQFERTFVTSSGLLSSFNVPAGGNTQIGQIAVSCSAPGSINGNAEASFNTAPLLAGSDISTPVATQSAFGSGSDHYYKMGAQSGYLEVHATAFTLFSRADMNVELLNSAGQRLGQNSVANVLTNNVSTYVNYDAMTSADLGSTPQDVYVHVYTRGTLSTSSFPSNSIGVSNTRYYVLTASRGAPGAFYANNARCESADAFGAYSSPGEAPNFTSSSDSQSTSGCGTIENIDHDPMSPGSLLRMGNFAMLALMLIVLRRKLREVPAGQTSH